MVKNSFGPIIFIFKYFFLKNVFKFNYQGVEFLIRPRNFDFFIILEVFLLNSYKPKIFTSTKSFDNVLDLGANIGSFTLWFDKNYQYKKIVCVEPLTSNFDLLKMNTGFNKLKKVTLLNNAIYSKNTNIEMSYPLKLKKSFRNDGMHRLRENKSGKVKAFTFKKILDDTKLKTVDYLKMDIEGAEKYVLTPENEEIFKKRVSYIILEAHDYLGYKKEDAYNYFLKLGFKVKYRKANNIIPSFSNCVVIEALNPKVV